MEEFSFCRKVFVFVSQVFLIYVSKVFLFMFLKFFQLEENARQGCTFPADEQLIRVLLENHLTIFIARIHIRLLLYLFPKILYLLSSQEAQEVM